MPMRSFDELLEESMLIEGDMSPKQKAYAAFNQAMLAYHGLDPDKGDTIADFKDDAAKKEYFSDLKKGWDEDDGKVSDEYKKKLQDKDLWKDEMEVSEDSEEVVESSGSSKDVHAAFAKGMKACDDGKKASDNPYKEGTPECKAWHAGWDVGSVNEAWITSFKKEEMERLRVGSDIKSISDGVSFYKGYASTDGRSSIMIYQIGITNEVNGISLGKDDWNAIAKYVKSERGW